MADADGLAHPTQAKDASLAHAKSTPRLRAELGADVG